MRASSVLLLVSAGCISDPATGRKGEPCGGCATGEVCDVDTCRTACSSVFECGLCQVCANGLCHDLDPASCACTVDADCDDGDPCNGDEPCIDDICHPGTPVECMPSANPCIQNTCIDFMGAATCTGRLVPGCGCSAAAECDDGDPCNGAEDCVMGACGAGTDFDCGPSGTVCADLVCQNDNGMPSCVSWPINDGMTCQSDDACGAMYRCSNAMCEPQVVTDCTPPQCEVFDGCDSVMGCQFSDDAVGTMCDDNDACTNNDQCDGMGDCGGNAIICGESDGKECTIPDCDPMTGCIEVNVMNMTSCNEDADLCTLDECMDGDCVLASNVDCDDMVGCTDDSCDPMDGMCTNAPDDGNCTANCQVGTCDTMSDCQFVNEPNFIDCDDSDGATSQDLCLGGACLGRVTNNVGPSASGCGSISWENAKDLDYRSGRWWGLFDHECSAVDHTGIFEVIGDSTLTHVSSTPGRGNAVERGFVMGDNIGNDVLGTLSTSTPSVTWSGTTWHTALGTVSGFGGALRGASYHGEGTFPNMTNHTWFFGDAAGGTAGFVARCAMSGGFCFPGPCTPTCSREFSFPFRHPRGLAATDMPASCPMPPCLFTSAYGGAVVSTQTAADEETAGSPARARIYEDPTLDYTVTSFQESADGETTDGLVQLSDSEVLIYGSAYARWCTDGPPKTGDFSCSSIALPNLSTRSYYDGYVTSAGDVLLLSSTCLGLCIIATYHVALLPAGADPTVTGNWRELTLGSFNGIGAGGVYPSAVAASDAEIYVLGANSPIPGTRTYRIWHWR